jgi:phosphoglycolate phosphatase
MCLLPPRVGSRLWSVNARNGHDLVKRLEDDVPAIARPRIVYADLDGTLVGPGGCLCAMPQARWSLSAARAIHALHASGIELVIASGRTRRGLFEPARLLGARAYIAELGALIVEQFLPEEVVIPTYDASRGRDAPYLEMMRSGAGGYLLQRFEGLLESHTPWTRQPREATMLFRGLVVVAEANDALRQAGYGWLELQDNGRLQRTSESLAVPEVHAYHLTPRGVSKASGVRLHRQRRGIPPNQAVAIGDAPADLAIGPEVAAVFIVANGTASIGTDAREPPNARSTAATHGDGFAEVVERVILAAPEG